MKKLLVVLVVLLSFLLLIYGCENKKISVQEKKIEVKWPTFTNEQIQTAKNVAKEYYKNKNLPHEIERIDYDMTTDENGNIYNSAFGSLSKYKNNDSIIFLVHTKDIDGYDQARLIVLKRENKDSESWKVIDEGL